MTWMRLKNVLHQNRCFSRTVLNTSITLQGSVHGTMQILRWFCTKQYIILFHVVKQHKYTKFKYCFNSILHNTYIYTSLFYLQTRLLFCHNEVRSGLRTGMGAFFIARTWASGFGNRKWLMSQAICSNWNLPSKNPNL